MLPLWSGYPDTRDRRSRRRFVVGALVAAAAAFSILLLDPNPLHGGGRRSSTTPSATSSAAPRRSRSGTGGSTTRRAFPTCTGSRTPSRLALVLGALALYRWPRRRSPLQIAAFTGALLVGFEMVLTHWFYLYLPWFFPFVAFAVLAPRTAEAAVPVAEEEEGHEEHEELVSDTAFWPRPAPS